MFSIIASKLFMWKLNIVLSRFGCEIASHFSKWKSTLMHMNRVILILCCWLLKKMLIITTNLTNPESIHDKLKQLYDWPLYVYVISYTQDYYTTIEFFTLRISTPTNWKSLICNTAHILSSTMCGLCIYIYIYIYIYNNNKLFHIHNNFQNALILL